MSNHDIERIEKMQQDILQRNDTPKPGSTWRHYKGELYCVKGLVMRESTEDMDVCYSNLKRPLPYSWSRPLTEWSELVNHNEELVPRFVLIKE